MTPVLGTGQLDTAPTGYAPAVARSSAGGGPKVGAVAMRTRGRNGTEPTGQHAMLLDAERVGGQDDACASTSVRARAEMPGEKETDGSVGVPLAPDPRVVRIKLPSDEGEAREGVGET